MGKRVRLTNMRNGFQRLTTNLCHPPCRYSCDLNSSGALARDSKVYIGVSSVPASALLSVPAPVILSYFIQISDLFWGIGGYRGAIALNCVANPSDSTR